MPRNGKETNKKLRKEVKNHRGCLKVVYDVNTEHYRPHVALRLLDLNEDIPLSVIALR
ncbi:MAG: hypothetical protein HW401_743 [Parcubacteria group bacterium]|nr:hypothetical protein [Parcubacteria group bacterium]